jgi:hypothetical protein
MRVEDRVAADPATFIAAMFRKMDDLDKAVFNFCIREAVAASEGEVERISTQLAGCLSAAEGWGLDCIPEQWGWSPAFEAVKTLRKRMATSEAERERLSRELLHAQNDVTGLSAMHWVDHERIEALEDMLRLVQWSASSRTYGEVCPRCGRTEGAGHNLVCGLGALLTAKQP